MNCLLSFFTGRGVLTRRLLSTAAPRLSGLCACLLALIALAPGVARAQSFGTPVNLTASFGTHSVAVGDFNNDGNPDLASANNGGGTGGTVSVFLGAGNGTFGPKTDLPAVRNAQTVVAGDFDKDGKTDLAVANSNIFDSQSVSIFQGNGDGTFQAKADFPVDGLANEVITADFNADGNPDLALVTSSVVDVLLGKGDGTFQPKVFYFVSSFASSLVAADFNGDGRTDIAAAGNPNGGSVDVLIGKGDGTFQEATHFPCGPGPQGLASGDLNGDGKLDLATANTHTNTVSVLLGNGDGTFQPKSDFVAGQVPQSLKVADFDGDGKADVVVASQSPALYLLRGNGDGTLRAVKNYDTGGGNPIYVNVGDLNHDNKVDLIGASYGGSLQVLINRTGTLNVSGRVLDDSGSPLAATSVTLFGPDTASVSVQTAADGSYTLSNLPSGANVTVTPSRHNYAFTPPGTNFPNLTSDATANFTGTLLRYNLTGVVFDTSGGRLRGVTVTLSGDASATTTTADDGSFTFSSLPGSGNYTVTPTLARFVFSPPSRTFNDLSANRTSNFNGSLQTFTISGTIRNLAAGLSTATPVLVTLSGSKTATATTNINGTYSFNGLTIGGDYTVTVSPVTQNGLFTDYRVAPPLSRRFTNLTSDATADFSATPLGVPLTQTNPFGAAVADFDGDGKQDLAVSYSFSNVDVMLGNGDGTFRRLAGYSAGVSIMEVVPGDLNGDGKVDLVMANYAGGIVVAFGKGDGTFQPPAHYPVSRAINPRFVILADFNGDGKLDAAAALTNVTSPGVDTPSLAVWLNKGDGTFNAPSYFGVLAYPWALKSGDFNGDGKPDLVSVSSSAFGNVASVLLGNGNGTFAAAVDYPTAVSPFVVAVGDYNKDGKLDVATGNGNSVSVMLGNGDGTLRPRVDYPVLSGSRYITQADFNGDGALDLAVTAAGGNAVGVLTGKGDGTFNAPVNFTVGLFPQGASAGDFNGDGRPDLVAVADTGGSGAVVRLFLNTSASPLFQFGAATFGAGEAAGVAVINVTRMGDTSQPASVEYSTADLTASERTDYTAALGTLRFAPGESSKSFNVFITDDALVEGDETVALGLGNPTGAGLGSLSTATLTITSDDSAPSSSNPNDDSQFYVRQHYRDFLGRDPDASGLAFWTNEIEQCGADLQCREVKRINVSAAFFLSIEFKETGYLVYRLNQAAFNTGESLRLRSFLPDTQEIGRGVIVGVQGWEQQLEANKQAFIAAFVNRPAFTNAYPASLTPAQFVDALNANTFDPSNPGGGGSLTPAERERLIEQITAAGNTSEARAAALRAIVENAEFSRRQSNKAFVLMQYFGYLRRNPDDLPDRNFAGYDFWLGKLNEFHGNYIQAEMVKAFITSDEYRKRFGQ